MAFRSCCLFLYWILKFNSGTTDYMDRFIDEQDSSRDRSSSPNFYSLMFGTSDGRKGLSLYPGAKSQLHMGENNGANDLSAAANNPPTSSVASSAPGSQTVQPNSESGSNTNGRLQVLADNTSDPSSQPKSP